ncbi:MAG TPA: response regulator, partial [Polyangiales bacterium]|nr:response regulator [Polyangiales bacterium]
RSAQGRVPARRSSIALEPAATPARKRLLLVDDSATTRTLEKSILEAAGFEVVTAIDGGNAWQLLQEHGADLVVSDVEMPNMNGFVLTQTIRSSKRFRDVPVILLTSLDSEQDRSRGMEAGADAYLVKSAFDQGNLLETIRQLL